MAVDVAKVKEVLAAKAGARLKMWLSICARCALCADACHFYRSEQRPEFTPAYRLKPLLEVVRRGGDVDEELIKWLVEVDYGTCTMCQRCTMYCPYGIGINVLVRAARSIAVAAGATPDGLAKGMANAFEFGNNLGILKDEYVETVEWQLDELSAEMPDAAAPMDKVGAHTLVTFHPRDIKFYPQNLYSYLKIYNAAGEDFTLTSTGWDSTNIGLFSGDDAMATVFSGRVVEAAERLKVQRVVVAE